MTILLDFDDIPDSGPVELTFKRSFHIRVTADEAKRSVSEWLVDEVSYMIAAGKPTLLIGEKIAWRVPAILTAPHIGEVGIVGTVDVDVQSGDSTKSASLKSEILGSARELSSRMPPYTRNKTTVGGIDSLDITPVKLTPTGNPLDIVQQVQ